MMQEWKAVMVMRKQCIGCGAKCGASHGQGKADILSFDHVTGYDFAHLNLIFRLLGAIGLCAMAMSSWTIQK